MLVCMFREDPHSHQLVILPLTVPVPSPKLPDAIFLWIWPHLWLGVVANIGSVSSVCSV